VSHGEYSVFFILCPLFTLAACTGHAGGRTPREALAASAEAIEANDGERLFAQLDERVRFALGGVVSARQRARQLIQTDYPPSEKAGALAALGDAGEVDTAAQLFARRCGPDCMAKFADLVGAPASEVVQGEEVEVTTVRGRILHMHAGKDGRFGIVWNLQAATDEVRQASRELAQIKENADVYRRKAELLGRR